MSARDASAAPGEKACPGTALITRRGRPPWWQPVLSLSSGVRRILLMDLVSSVGTGVIVPFLAVYAVRVRHHHVIVGGLVVAALAAGSLGANVVAGQVVDSRGARVALRGGWLVAAVGDLALLASGSVPLLLTSAVIIGGGTGTAYPALRALLAERALGPERRLTFALQHGLLNVGLSVGAVLAAVVLTNGQVRQYQALYLLDSASFITAALLLTFVALPADCVASDHSEAGGGGYREVIADPAFRRFAFISGLLVICGFAQFHAALPLYLSRPHGLSARGIALVFAANTATVAVVALPIAVAVRQLTYATLIKVGAVAFAVSWALLAASGRWGPSLAAVLGACLAASIMGLGEALLSPALGPVLNDIAPGRLRGQYNSADAVLLSAGTIIGPLTAASLYQAGSPPAMFAFLIGGCVTAAVATTQSIWRPVAVAVARQGRES